ncbi:MAG: F0F1 ATP synthase subunit B [Dehalococcoidia bacterium]|nr:F0F1 ATP synthase subunit B [Dehalococcoidia bacterium]
MEAAEALGINLPGLIAQIVNFSILFALLSLMLYKPVLSKLDERATRIRESLEKAEEVKREAERTEQQFQSRIQEARQEGQAIITQAGKTGERLVEDARQKARQEGEALLTRARSEIEMERDRAITQLQQRFADLTVLAAGKVIGQSLDKEAHASLIEEVLKESRGLRNN